MWEYLDRMDKNLLYMYAALLQGQQKQIHRYNRQEEVTEEELHQREIQDKNDTLYLVWFVYRYVLGCKTLEEALALPVTETLEKYKLKKPILSSRVLYLGIDKDILLWKEEDMAIVLEILYKRLNFWEQLDCFIEKAGKGSGKKMNIRQKRCLEAKERYKALLSEKNKKGKFGV